MFQRLRTSVVWNIFRCASFLTLWCNFVHRSLTISSCWTRENIFNLHFNSAVHWCLPDWLRWSEGDIDYILWCDSQIVLHWLRTFWKSLNILVGNRVSEFQQVTGTESWYYITIRENPSDLASRGVQPNVLANSSLWWNGHNWLKFEPLYLPK